MKRENREKLNLNRSNLSREGMQARQTSALVRQIKSQASLNLSRDTPTAQRTQQPNIYLVQTNAARDRLATSANTSGNRFDYRKQRGNSNLKPHHLKKSLRDDSFQYAQRDRLDEEQGAPLHNQSLDHRLDNDSRMYLTRAQMNSSVDAALIHQGRGASCKVSATPQSYKKTTNAQHNTQQRVSGFQRIEEDDETNVQHSVSINTTIAPRTPAKNPTEKRPQTAGKAKKAAGMFLKHTAASRQKAIDADALRKGRYGQFGAGHAVTPKATNILPGDPRTPQSHQTQQKIKSNQKDKSGAKKKLPQAAFYLNLQFLNKSGGEFQHTASSGAQSQLKGQSVFKQGKTRQSGQYKDSHGQRIHGKEDRDGAIRIEDELEDDASYESKSRMLTQSYGRLQNQPYSNKKINEDSHKYFKGTDKRGFSHQSAPGLKHVPYKPKEKYQMQNQNRESDNQYFQNQEMRSRLSEEATSESKNAQSPRWRTNFYSSVEEKNDKDVQQKIKMKELGNQYMKKSSRSCKKSGSRQPAAQHTLNTKEEEEMILERMRQAQAEYMHQKIINAEKNPGPKTRSCDGKAQKQSKYQRASIDTQKSKVTRQSSQNVQSKAQSRAQAKADMQKKLKFLYQKLGAVMRGYKARRIYHNNKQIKQFRFEFRDLIQFAYSLKIEIQNLQNRLKPDDPQIEKTKQLLLTSLKDLIQKRQQFAFHMDRLYNPHNNLASRTRSRSPEKVGNRVEWIAQSQPRFIQSAQFKQEVQRISAASVGASDPTSQSKQSRRDLRSRSQYRKQFINTNTMKAVRQLQDDSSVENREELNQSIYREEASREGLNTGSKPKLTRSPQKESRLESPLKLPSPHKEQRTLNSDLMHIDYSRKDTGAPATSSAGQKSQPLTFGAGTRAQSITDSGPETQSKSNTGYRGGHPRGSIVSQALQREVVRHAVSSLEERFEEGPNRRAKPTKSCSAAPSKPLAARRSTLSTIQADKSSKHPEQVDQKHSEQQPADERKRPQSQLGERTRTRSLAERRDYLKKTKNAGYVYDHMKSIDHEREARSRQPQQDNHMQSVEGVSIDVGLKADQDKQKAAQAGAASPLRTLQSSAKGEYESPYKYQAAQSSQTRAGTRNFMQANIQRIKRMEEQRRLQSASVDLTASRNHSRGKLISSLSGKVMNASVSVDRAEPKTEEKAKQPFVSKIPRLSPSKSPVKTQQPAEAGSKQAAKRAYAVGSKVAEYIYQSVPAPCPPPGQGAPDGKLLQTNERIRQSNQNYIKRVLNASGDKNRSTSSQRHYQRSSFAHSVQSSSFAKQDQAAEQETVHQGASSKAHFASTAVGQYRGGAKSSSINNRYEHQRTYSNVSSMSKLQNEQSVCINVETRPEIAESRSPSPQRSRQPSPARADTIEQRVSPARSQFSEDASPSRALQRIIERFSPLKNATFENQYIQKRKPSKGKPASVIRVQQRVQEAPAPAEAAVRLNASDAILRREPSPQAGAIKTPVNIHTVSEISMSQIAESPAPARQAELNPESPHQYAQSRPISPGKAVSNVQPAVTAQGLATLESQRIHSDINMFDQNRRCLDLRRSSNFNSFATSEFVNSRTCQEGSAAKRESPKRGNPYLDLRETDLQHLKVGPTSHKLDDYRSGKTEKDGDSTFRLCPQTVQNSSSKYNSNITSNVTSTRNQYVNKHLASPSHNPCSESSPIKTRSMAMREPSRDPGPVEESPSKLKNSPAKSPSSAKKSYKSRKYGQSPNKENAYVDAPFSIELVAAPKFKAEEVNESQRFQNRRRSRGERSAQGTQRQSTRRTGQPTMKRTGLSYQHTAYQHTFKAPALQEQPSNCSIVDIKTPTSYMAMEYVGSATKGDFPVKAPFLRTQTCTPSKPAMKSAAAAGLSTPLRMHTPIRTPSRNRSAQALPALPYSSQKKAGARGLLPSYQRLSNNKRSQQSCLTIKPVLQEQKERHSGQGMTTPKGSVLKRSRYDIQSASRDAPDNMSSALNKIQHAVNQLQQQQYEQAQSSDSSNMQAVIESLQEQVLQMNQLMAQK